MPLVCLKVTFTVVNETLTMTGESKQRQRGALAFLLITSCFLARVTESTNYRTWKLAPFTDWTTSHRILQRLKQTLTRIRLTQSIASIPLHNYTFLFKKKNFKKTTNITSLAFHCYRVVTDQSQQSPTRWIVRGTPFWRKLSCLFH